MRYTPDLNYIKGKWTHLDTFTGGSDISGILRKCNQHNLHTGVDGNDCKTGSLPQILRSGLRYHLALSAYSKLVYFMKNYFAIKGTVHKMIENYVKGLKGMGI